MAGRTYNEKEVAKLLERAAELHKQRHSGTHTAGLTLEELEHVAEEAGIDPELLRIAASELDGPGGQGTPLPGTSTKTHNHVERFVAAELTEKAWENIQIELRHRYDSDYGTMMGAPQYGKGVSEKLGDMYEWKHISSMGIVTRVLARPSGEGFTLQMSQRVGMASMLTESIFYGSIVAMISAGIAMAISKIGMIALLASFATLLVAIPLIYHFDKSWRKKKHHGLATLADDLGALFVNQKHKSEKAKPLSPKERAAENWSRIDLDAALPDDLEEPLDDQPAQHRRDRST